MILTKFSSNVPPLNIIETSDVTSVIPIETLAESIDHNDFNIYKEITVSTTHRQIITHAYKTTTNINEIKTVQRP